MQEMKYLILIIIAMAFTYLIFIFLGDYTIIKQL
jgi:hypothetical protein